MSKLNHRAVLNLMIILLCTIFSFNVFAGDDTSTDNEPIIVDELPDVSISYVGREEGLLSMSVSSMIQDKYGFIWIGTQGGLHRYDGQKMTVYRNDPFKLNGLPDNLIQTMFYDDVTHEIWMGTYQGISRYIIEENRFINYTVDSHGLSHDVIVAIEKQSEELYWIGTLEGLNLLNVETEEVINFDISEKTVRSLKLASNQKLYIGTYDGLMYIDINSSNMDTYQAAAIKRIDTVFGDNYVMSVQEYDAGTLILGVWGGGVYEYNMKDGTYIHIPMQDNRVYVVNRTYDGVLWVGTWGGGLYLIENHIVQEIYNTVQEGGMSNLVVYSMLEGTDGIHWVGTNGGGIIRFNPYKSNYQLYTTTSHLGEGLMEDRIYDMIYGRNGNLYIGTANQGLNIIDRNTHELKILKANPDDPNAIPSNTVRCIINYGQGILMGTDVGLGFFEPETMIYDGVEAFDGMTVYDITVVDNEIMYVGTLKNGLIEYNLETEEMTKYTNTQTGLQKLSDNHVYSVISDSNGRLWVGTDYGINMRESRQEPFVVFNKKIGNDQSIPSQVINYIMEDSWGQLWFAGGAGGLFKYNEDGTFTTYTELDGLASNSVSSIQEGQGVIMAATDLGISILNPETEAIWTLTPQDGIGGYDYGRGSVEYAGNVYFSGSHGITKLPKVLAVESTIVPILYITNVKSIRDKEESAFRILNGQETTFEYSHNSIEIDYTLLDYTGQFNERVVYTLEGVDDTFIEVVPNESIQYLDLRSGTYQFRIKIVGENKEIIKEVSTTIIIEKPWYQSIFAYISYMLLIMLVFYFIYLFFESRKTKQRNFSLSIKNNKLEVEKENLETLSLTDALTGVNNRRFLMGHLLEYMALAKRNNETYVSIVIIDIDNFKEINDTYGHNVGDELLVSISQRINQSLSRITDIVARFGGDEFIVVLYDTKLEEAMTIAEKIRQTISECEINVPGHGAISTTGSIGVKSIIPDLDMTPEDAIRLADKELYKAKENGKNNVSGGFYDKY